MLCFCHLTHFLFIDCNAQARSRQFPHEALLIMENLVIYQIIEEFGTTLVIMDFQ